MGMSIAEPIQTLEYLRDSGIFPFSTKEGVLYRAESIDVAIETMRKYQMMQADYENRLKADLVAMLTEILLEAEENTVRWYVGRVDGKSDDVVLMETINDIIQQKINEVEEE